MARKNWLLGLGAVAVIAVPLGVALKQDLGKEQPARTEAPAAPAATPVAKETPPAPTAPTSRMDTAFFRDVLGAGKAKPELVGPLFRVQWGVARDELKLTAPELFSWHHPDVVIGPRFDDDKKLAAVVIDFPDDGTAQRLLRAAWGETWRSVDGALEVSLATAEPGRARVVFSPPAR